MNLFQVLKDDSLSNVDIRWPGMSQDCPCPICTPIDSPPVQSLDTPGTDYQDYVGGPFSGTFQPGGPTAPGVNPRLDRAAERTAQYNPTANDPASWGRPSGATGNVFTPSPNTDRIVPEVIPPFRSGVAARAFGDPDVQSGSRADSISGNPGLILRRMGMTDRRLPVAFCQEQGQMPPTMGAAMASLDSAGILRSGIPIAAGSAILPGEQITLFAQLGSGFGGDIVRFTIRDSADAVVFGPVEKRKDLFSTQVHLDITGPVPVGAYILEATELILLFPDNTLTFPFSVSVSAPPPPVKPPGTLGSIQGIVIALAVLAGVVLIAPAVKRVTE